MPSARAPRTVEAHPLSPAREAAMPTTSSTLSDLHHEMIGSGPPVLFISGATGDAGHFTRTAAALVEELEIAPAIAFGTSGGANILLDLVARRPDVLSGAIVHEPAVVTLMEPQTPDERLERMADLGEVDPRRAMEELIRLRTDDATFAALDPHLRERMLGNGERFFAEELGAFLSDVPDVESIREAHVALRVLTSDRVVPGQVDAAARLAGRLGLEPQSVAGHHAPHLQHPEAFAEQLRPILRELS